MQKSTWRDYELVSWSPEYRANSNIFKIRFASYSYFLEREHRRHINPIRDLYLITYSLREVLQFSIISHMELKSLL